MSAFKKGAWVRWVRTALTTACTEVPEGTVGQVDDLEYGLRVKIGAARWRFPRAVDLAEIPAPTPQVGAFS